MNRRLELHIDHPGLHEITKQVQAVVKESGVDDGLCTVFVQHTSAGVIINEGADPAVRRDLEAWLARLVPEGDDLYTHNDEGPDDMPSHIRAMLTGVSEEFVLKNDLRIEATRFRMELLRDKQVTVGRLDSRVS